MNKKLTVIICSCNRTASLLRTLGSIVLQEIPENTDVDILVADNNSSDNTKDEVERFAETSLIPVRYRFESRQGKTFALNNAISNSSAEFLLFTDDDTVVNAGWIKAVVHAFQENPECDVFGGKIVPLLHEGVTLPAWVRQEEPHYNAEGPLGDHNKGDYVRSYYEADMGTPCGANFFVRRNVFEEYGLYDENLNRAVKDLPMAEDSAYCFKLKKKNIPMLYIADAIVYHDTPAEKLTKQYFRSYICRMSRAYVHAAKVELGTKRILNIPRYVLRMAAERFFCYLRSIATGEDVGLKFSKQLELLQTLAICYWYFSDRGMLSND